MTMNLITDAWIPIRRKSGIYERIAPWQITELNDPVLTIESGRPDFDGSLIQFIIGLLQTAASPQNHDEWMEKLEDPPDPAELKAAFMKYSEAFNLNGDGPQFMQDFAKLDGKASNISELLIDAPGVNTIKENKDHFVKRQTNGICLPCAAIALFTLQINAPGGGKGHRTSLRGGGPLTTLIILDPKGSELAEIFWRNAWLNVFDKEKMVHLTGNLQNKDDVDIFPWLAKTRTSEKKTGRNTTPEDASPLQQYWCMPRRIKILWDNHNHGSCNLCGEQSEHLVDQYLTKNYGVNYEGAWQHPLSPHIKSSTSEIFVPQHPQPGGVSYTNWLGMILKTDSHAPALIVDIFRTNRQTTRESFRLYTFGYDMDNMKARCWYDSTFPLYEIPDRYISDFMGLIEVIIVAANELSRALRKSIKEAWFDRPGDNKGDTSFLGDVFFDRTEQQFFEIVKQLLEVMKAETNDTNHILKAWHNILQTTAFCLFEYWSMQGDFAQENPRRIATAHNNLRKQLNKSSLKLTRKAK